MTQRRIYQDEYPYFVTFRTNEGLPFFEDIKYTRLLSRVIFKTCNIKCFDVISYQIMPDHIHLLVMKNTRAQPAVVARGRTYMTAVVARQIKNVRHKTTNAGTAARVRNGEREDGGYNITDLLHGIKSYFINELRKKHDIPYTIWQRRFYTRIINNDEYFKAVLNYIKRNPIKGSLPSKYHKSPYQYFNWDIISKTLK
ncbi:MAG: transposase [Patescibacteria group bacterium]|nr:transposase [Patescibacteria group bacterium]